MLCLLCISSGLLASCTDPDNIKDDIIPVEPPYEPMFQFDEQGIPYRLNSPNLSQEMQQDLLKEVIGYGWMPLQTFKIFDDGNVDSEDYYASRDGAGPKSYFFKSDKELVSYFYAAAIPAMAFWSHGFTMDAATGVLSDGNIPTGLSPWSFYLRIWSIYYLNQRWYMTTIEPLGLMVDSNEEYKIVWGYSQYFRMSDAELQEMQEEFTFDYSQVN